MPVVNSKTRSKLKRGISNSGTANLRFKKSKKRIRLTSTFLNHKWLTVIKQALLLAEDSQLCLLLKCFN